MSFGSRLKARREQLGITQIQLAQKLGITKGAVGNYEAEISSPKADILYRVFDVLQCDANYLFQDEMKMQTYRDKATPEEMTHIKKYRTLDRYGKEAVDAVLDVECRRYAEYKAALAAKEEEEDSHVIEMPSYLQSASAGYGNWLEEAEEITITVPDTPMTRRADFAIRVSGDSMEPRYSDGDLVFVKKQEDVEVGEYGIWIVDGSAYIKKRGVDRLISLNRQYPDVEQGEDVHCVGKVIGKL